ncbi:MAG: hypothetical protein LLH30_15725 [Candidatus Manganitrophus sp. SA1]|nr:hypothetical protein [Candidatus Manganitrophus morganii]
MAGILEATKEERQILKLDGLLSLWDMLRVYANNYIVLGIHLGHITTIIKTSETAKEEGFDRPLTDKQKERLETTLIAIETLCKDLSLSTSLELISASIKDPPQTIRELAILSRAVNSELKQRLFLFIPPHRASYYENTSLLSERARIAFPSVVSEIRDAGNSYATGLYNACVFHLMRAVEIGVQKMAAGLGVAYQFPIDLASMQDIIGNMEKIIKDIHQQKKTAEKIEDLTFYSKAAVHCDHFKDAFRNHVTHARSNYDEDQAERIMRNVLDFYNAISEKLKE